MARNIDIGTEAAACREQAARHASLSTSKIRFSGDVIWNEDVVDNRDPQKIS